MVFAPKGRRISAQGKLVKRAPPWVVSAPSRFALKGQRNADLRSDAMLTERVVMSGRMVDRRLKPSRC